MTKLERRRPRWLPALAVGLAVAIAGCGPSGGGEGGQHREHAARPAHDMEAMGIQPIGFTGAHSLRVEAVASNHAPYHRDGEPVFARDGEPVFAVTAVQAG